MITGVIAEYNIFHNGHKYQLDEIKKRSDAVVAVISGSFVQRGDVAVCDKWARARIALLNGADLVLELPVCYALNAAPGFAEGGVGILDSLGVVDSICFGSECGDIDRISAAALLLENETKEISDKIKKYSAKGMSYPSAVTKAYGGVIPEDILSEPNNILALEYVRAIYRRGSEITPFTVKRQGAEHDAVTARGNTASASALRSGIKNGDDISAYIPYPISELGDNFPFDASSLDIALLSRLRTMSAGELKNINEVSEGIENRIIACARDARSMDELTALVKNKRYTESKIRRILFGALIGFTKDIYTREPQYIRVLGMNKTGTDILRRAKKTCAIPIITKTADFRDISPQFALDLRATDVAMLCAPADTRGGKDFTTPPVRVKALTF